MEIVEEEPWEVWIGVPPESANTLCEGDPFEVQIGGQLFAAKVRAVLAELDSTTRTRTTILTLVENTQHEVVPGQLARVRIDQRIETPGYWVPLTALTRDTGGLWSLLIAEPTDRQEHVISSRLVEILYTNGEQAFVRGTIKQGELAVTQGVHRLALGQHVDLRERSSLVR